MLSFFLCITDFFAIGYLLERSCKTPKSKESRLHYSKAPILETMPSSSHPVSSFLDQAKGAVVGIEFQKQILHPVEVTPYIKNFAPSLDIEKQTTEAFAKLIYPAHHGSVDLKIKTFGSNQFNTVNQRKQVQKINDAIAVVATWTSSIDSVPIVASGVELVTRLGFPVKDHAKWMAQVDLVKRFSGNPAQLAHELASAKSQLVGVPLDVMKPSAFDYLQISLGFISDENISFADIAQVIKISGGGQLTAESANYQTMLYALAKDIFRDRNLIDRFRYQSGFKRLGSNTVELSRPIYFTQVLPKIGSFYLTDKIDGVRAMLIIDEVYRRSGHRKLHQGTSIKAVSDKVYDIQKYEETLKSSTIETQHTVLDVEMMTDNSGKMSFYCFDVIILQSHRLSNSPFKDRYTRLEAAGKLMKRYKLGSVKEFVKLSADRFGEQIMAFYKKPRSYEIDGLIFTPRGKHFHKARKQQPRGRLFNTDYASTVSFKWKPRSQLTIDFYFMCHPTKEDAYVLCSGVDINTFQKLRLQFFDGYVAPVSSNSQQYFPIQFAPAGSSFNNIWSPTTKKELEIVKGQKSLDGLVGEFAFVDEKDKLLDSPRLVRLRLDRKMDIAKGEYYGNAMRYAELIWHSVQHPLSLETLCDAKGVGYFADSDTDWYRAQRAFNSFVKSTLIKKFLYPNELGESRLVDLACGKGQDIARAIEIGFTDIVAVDKDADALYELKERKYNLRFKRQGASASVQVHEVDLENPASETISKINVREGSANAALCSFAIHYICHSGHSGKTDPLVEFVKLTKHLLKPGGRLLITAFDGLKIFDLLKSREEWTLEDDNQVKYAIKREFNSDSFIKQDQKIGVLLPFSGGDFYSEYLVNYKYLEELFIANGFKMIETNGFGTLLSKFQSENPSMYAHMSAADKSYVQLYGYFVVERM